MFLYKFQGRWRFPIALLVLLAAVAILQGCHGGEHKKDTVAAAPDPAQSKQLQRLHELADELKREAEAGEFTKARERLLVLGELATAVSYQGAAAVEGVDVFMDTVVDAKRQFNAARIKPDLARKAAVKLNLATDALTHPHQPMWLEYYNVLTENGRLLEAALASPSIKDAQSRYTALKDHYDTIRPAVWISRAPEEGEKMDSLLGFIERRLQEPDTQGEALLPLMKQWKTEVDSLFRKSDDRSAYYPIIQPDDPVKWSLTIGSLIVGVLGYAAWRMFQTDRTKVQYPRRYNGD